MDGIRGTHDQRCKYSKDHQQSKPELKELVRYSNKIARCWKQLALELSLSVEDVDVIDVNCVDVNDKCYEMFNTWLRRTCDSCWCQVANALKIVKLNEVAIEAENKLVNFADITQPVNPAAGWNDDNSKQQTRKRLSSIDEVEAEFGIMVTKIQEALTKSDIDVSKLLIKLKSSSAVRDREVPLFDPGIFERVKSIDKLFETLSGYWHLFDYDVLMYLVNTAECKEAKILLYDDFLASFDSSVMSNDHQLILNYHKFNEGNILPGTCKLRVKVAHDECTAEVQRRVKCIIADYFNLEKYSLILKGIKQGCTELTFQISPSVYSHVLQYEADECSMLQMKSHMIVSIKVDSDVELMPPDKHDTKKIPWQQVPQQGTGGHIFVGNFYGFVKAQNCKSFTHQNLGLQIVHENLKIWYRQMKTIPLVFDNIIQSPHLTFPYIGYLSVFHDSLSQPTEGIIRQKESTLKALSHIQGLFESSNFTSGKRSILIEGHSGIGKTTLCKEICYQWAENNLITTDELVLLLLLHDPNAKKITSVLQLADYFSTSTMTKHEILEYLKNGGGARVTIILDGYNQLNVKEQKTSFFRDLIDGRSLAESRIIVTSRPSGSQCLCDCVERRIELFELAKYYKHKSILASLQNDPSKLKILRKHILRYPEIELSTRTPINVTIMISLCRHFNCPLPTTATEMYEKFVLFAIRHQTNYFTNRIEDFPQSILDILKQLEYFAYESLMSGKETFQKIDLLDVCRKDFTCFGLMQPTEYYCPLNENKIVVFNFLHHGIQEYLAARYIASMPNNEIVKYLLFPDIWNKELLSMWVLAFDIIRIESKVSSLQQKLNYTLTQLENDLSSVKLLDLFQVLRGTKKYDDIIAKKFSGSNLDFSYHQLISYQITSLGALLLSDTLKNINELHLSGCHIKDHGLYLLQKYVSIGHKQLNVLDLCNNNLTAAASSFLSSICDYVKPKSLQLSYNNLRDAGVMGICDAVKRNKIGKLELVGTNITVEGAKAVSIMLSGNNLEEIDISHNNIGDDGIEVLSQKLSRSTALKCLFMRYCNIGEVGACELAHALTINSSLEILWINGNAIGHAGAVDIAAALCINNTLKELSLTGDSSIDYTAASEILSSFNENTILTDLDLPAELTDKLSMTVLEDINTKRSNNNHEFLCVSFW